MRFGDFLKATVLLSAGCATLLATLDRARHHARGRPRGRSTSPPAGGSPPWRSASALGARAETSPPIARLLADARTQSTLPELHPGTTLVNRLWPLLLATIGAGAAGVRGAAGRLGGGGLHDHLGARLAAPGARGAGDRGARRRALLRRPHLAVLADPADPHARASAATTSRAVRDVLLVSLGGTAGLREADAELAASLRRAGASVEVAAARPVREWRTMAAIELAWALSARRAARAAGAGAGGDLLELDGGAAGAAAGRDPLRRARGRQPPGPPRALAAAGRAAALPRGARCSCRGARAALAEAPRAARRRGRRAGARRAAAGRPPSATSPRSPTAPTPRRRASTACSPRGPPRAATARSSWSRGSTSAARSSGRRATAGAPRACGSRGRCRATEYRALLRRARVFVTAPRREDHGIAQLEALADGCALVTTPSPGPYAALPIARELDPRLVAGRPRGRAARRARRARAGLRGARGGGAAPVRARGGRPGGGRRAPAASAGLGTP